MRTSLVIGLLLLAGCATPGANESSSTAPIGHGTTSAPSSGGSATTSPTTTGRLPWSPGDWEEAACDLAPAPEPTMPDLLALDAKGLGLHSWEGTQYENRSWVSGPRHVAAIGKNAFTADQTHGNWTLMKRDAALALLDSRGVPAVGALTAYEGRLYVATNWNLTVYDADLSEVGRLPLDPPHSPYGIKALDGVEVHDGIAYLLDDVGMPFWVFRVDVHDPSRMMLLAMHELMAVNGGPFAQWLDPQTGTWYIGGRWGGQYEGRMVASSFLANGTAGPTILLSRSPGSYPAPSPQQPTGYAIGGGFLLPAWSVMLHEGNVELAKVSFEDATPRRSCVQPLWSGARAMHEHAGGLVVAGGGTLGVFGLDGALRMSQPWPHDTLIRSLER